MEIYTILCFHINHGKQRHVKRETQGQRQAEADTDTGTKEQGQRANERTNINATSRSPAIVTAINVLVYHHLAYYCKVFIIFISMIVFRSVLLL